MCQVNATTKTLTKKDFFNAFFNSNVKDSQTGETLKDLIFNEGMDIAAEAAYKLYRQTVEINSGLLLCLTERQDEFQSALKRGFENEFNVFGGWDADTFFVVNQANNSEYKVELPTIDEKSYASCECPDFIHRKRICKHIAQVLLNTMFGYRQLTTTVSR